jgi:2',3'-cyclic-nucleotide 3'-phosphodiesterase
MRTLLLLRGAPGSGKSTWIQENNLEQYTLEADSFRQLIANPVLTEAGDQRITIDSDRLAWKLLLYALELRMRRGDFTIIDATHSSRSMFRAYKELIEKYRYSVFYKNFDCSLEELLHRNETRPEHKRIPTNHVHRRHALIATNDIPPSVKEIQDISEIDNYYTMNVDQYKDIKVIGDVQGCYTVLMDALSDFNPETLYIFVGDLLDRGIENDQVLNWALEHAKDPNVIFIRGNHDIYLENWAFDYIEQDGKPIKTPHTFKYKTLPQLLGQKDYDYYKVTIEILGDTRYYAVNGVRTDIVAFHDGKNLITEPHKSFRDGSLHLIDPIGRRYDTTFSTYTVDEGPLKKKTRELMRRFRDAVALEFHGQKYFICHAGISALPKMATIPGFQLIQGVGNYQTQIDSAWEESYQNGKTQGFIQVHGHRNTDSTQHSICLEDNVEYGGNLCVLHITENGHELKKYKNTVFRIPEKETDSEMALKPWIPDTKNATTNSMIRNKYIRVKPLVKNLYSLNFTEKAFRKSIWSTETVTARGLFVDQTSGDIKIRSYNKFFNADEQTETQISALKRSLTFPIVAHKKYNGFLGIASVIDDELVLASKSMIDGPFVDYFHEIFDQLTPSEKDQLKELAIKYNCSFTFEVEHLEDRHIIDFKENQLTILDAIPNQYDLNGIHIDTAFSNKVLDQLTITSPFFKRKEWITNFDDIPSLMRYIHAHRYDRDSEGLVITDQKGFMFKIKYDYYKKVKALRGLKEEAAKQIRLSNNIPLSRARNALQVNFLNWLKHQDSERILTGHIIDLFQDFEKENGPQLIKK